MKALLASGAVVLALGSFAIAQTPSSPPAAAAAPAGKADKQAVSKACSDQANAKGLHGKARKKFRSDCRRTGGKPM